MSANSASRHLRSAASAALLLFLGAQMDWSVAGAQTSADLDSIIIASMQGSGRSAATQDGKSSDKNPDLKTGKRKAVHAQNEKKKIVAGVKPVVAETTPSSGGLLAAIGTMVGSSPSSDTPSLTVADGPAVFLTSGYGQALQQSPPQQPNSQNPNSGVPRVERGAIKPVAHQKFSAATASAAPAPTASVTAPATASPDDTPATPSGISGFFAALGFDASAVPSKSSAAKEDISAAPARPSIPAREPQNDRKNLETDQVASIDAPVSGGAEQRQQTRTFRTGGPSAVTVAKEIAAVKKPESDRKLAAPGVVLADSGSVEMPAASPAGNARDAAAPGPMEANAQISVRKIPGVHAEPTAFNRDATMARRDTTVMTSDFDYRVDAGDKLRIVVYGQEGLTNTYAIDAGGGITMPLIGRVVARGLTPAGVASHITARLRKGYIREPSVAVEVEAYRPFFILGEVAAPGQYPYVPNMSVEAAVAIAGGFSPRARRDTVTLTHKTDSEQVRAAVPLGTPLSPGDTIMVSERWF